MVIAPSSDTSSPVPVGTITPPSLLVVAGVSTNPLLYSIYPSSLSSLEVSSTIYIFDVLSTLTTSPFCTSSAVSANLALSSATTMVLSAPLGMFSSPNTPTTFLADKGLSAVKGVIELSPILTVPSTRDTSSIPYSASTFGSWLLEITPTILAASKLLSAVNGEILFSAICIVPSLMNTSVISCSARVPFGAAVASVTCPCSSTTTNKYLPGTTPLSG